MILFIKNSRQFENKTLLELKEFGTRQAQQNPCFSMLVFLC